MHPDGSDRAASPAVVVGPEQRGAALAADGSPPTLQASAVGGLYIPSLDGIRTFSFLIVFLSHAGLSFIPAHVGLTLFFFLSGYLITTLLRLEFEKTGDVSLKQFYLRRVLRIFPPFYLVLITASLLSAIGFLGGDLTPLGLLAQASHLTNYYIIGHGWWEGMAPGTWVYWSLAVEEHFYLVFPLLYLALRRRKLSNESQAALLLGLCLLLLAWRGVLVFALDSARDRTYVASDTRVDSILIGCVLAVWRNPILAPQAWRASTLLGLWLPLGFASVVLSLAFPDPRYQQTLRYTLQSFGLLPFFVAAIIWHDRSVFRLLNLRPIKYLGVLSYSLYLMHPSALWAFEQKTTWPAPVRGLVCLALLVALAALIHRYIERPCAAARRRLSKYLEAAPLAVR